VAEDTKKTTNQKRWALVDVAQGDVAAKAELWVTHVITVKDFGLPTETTEHNWEAEITIGRVKTVVAVASGMAEFDTALNELRLAIVDARNALATM
jgi:hypothetical protein